MAFSGPSPDEVPLADRLSALRPGGIVVVAAIPLRGVFIEQIGSPQVEALLQLAVQYLSVVCELVSTQGLNS